MSTFNDSTTSGKWELHEGGTSVQTEDGKIVASCGFLPKVPVWEARGNAKMIAESPAMVEAIKDAVEWIEDDRFDDDYIAEDWYHKMKAILGKLSV